MLEDFHYIVVGLLPSLTTLSSRVTVDLLNSINVVTKCQGYFNQDYTLTFTSVKNFKKFYFNIIQIGNSD